VQKLEYRDKKDREQVFWRSWESDNLCFAGDKKKRFRSRFAFLLLGIERNESLGKRRGGTNNHHRHRARELRFVLRLMPGAVLVRHALKILAAYLEAT